MDEIAVVGAGAVGVTAARELADRGADVTVFERGEVADGASGRAAGVCYDAYADRLDADLAARALDYFREFSGTGGFRFTDRPYVWLAREAVSRERSDGDRRRADAVRETAARMADRGLDVSVVDPTDLAARFPALETDDVAVAATAENAGYADPGDYTRAMAREAERAGAEIRTDSPVSVRPGPEVVESAEDAVGSDSGVVDEGPFESVLVAAGVHTRQVVADVAPLPVKPYRVQALVTEPVDVTAPMLYDATGGYYLRPRDGGLLVGDGTEPVECDPDDWDREADGWFLADAREHELAALGRAWPARRAWAGLCTATPDGNPLAGKLAEGVYVATGWQGHGFMRAPAFAERLAGELLGGEGIDAFAPTRFDGDETFEIVEGMALD